MNVLKSEPWSLRGQAAEAGWLAWRNYDYQLTIYAVLLTIFGLAMAYSNSVGPTHTLLAANSPFVKSMLWAVVAAVVLGLTTVLDYKWLRSFAWPLYLINIALLLVTLRFGQGTGEAAGTAGRWIVVGGSQFQFSFQFSELAKIVMVVVFAAYLADRRENLKSMWTIVGAIVIMMPPWVLVLLQPDLGTSLVLVAELAGALFMSGASLLWLGTLVATVAASVPFVWQNLQDYQKARLYTLLNPGADPNGAGYQIHQAEAAIHAGGVAGKGITNGDIPLPVQTTDFVWGLLAEELGLIGSLVVLVLFALMIWRLLLAAWRSNDEFAVLLGCGMAAMLFFQVAVNVGMVTGVLPVTGIPLPFITYGGASLVSLAAGLGFIQSINLRREKPQW
jgi:rod shape determining protein RodA